MHNNHYIKILLRAFLLSVMLWTLPSSLFAQNTPDSTLKEVNIKTKHKISADTRLNDFSPGQKIKTIDSATLRQYQLQSMATLLAQQVSVFIKSYGFNGLSTLNLRGSSSAQSAVLWNCVPISNAALGIADVSTLPVVFMNKVNVVYGGSSALWGSGNVGGALLLENETPVFDSGKRDLSFGVGLGSFSQYIGNIKGSISGKCWYFSANIFAQTAQNNFPYTNEAGAKTNMPNSALKSDAAMVQAAYKISTQNIISFSAWYQQYDRLIPPALFEPSSEQHQTDGSLRLLLNWTKQNTNSKWYAKSSFIQDNSHYRDDDVQLSTYNTAYQYYQEIGWKAQLHQYGQLLLFMPVQIASMQVQNQTKEQDRVALAAAYDLKEFHNRLDIALNARGETINGKGIFLPGADAAYAITNWLSVRANAQRTYRTPTLNELYYSPGGNPDLKPEQGWNEDGGYTVKLNAGRFTIYHDLSIFNRDIHDWIIWLGGSIWTPHNVSEVHSRGVETENTIAYNIGKWRLHIGVNTSYILATTVSSYVYNDGSIGKQLPYTPRYSGQANVGFDYNRFSFNYNHTYTGYRFTTVDESEYILPYQTGNVQLMYSTTMGHHSLQLSGQCNNIWNEQYQVVAFRPMPGINWLMGFRIGIF